MSVARYKESVQLAQLSFIQDDGGGVGQDGTVHIAACLTYPKPGDALRSERNLSSFLS